jgi:hypothetical protein
MDDDETNKEMTMPTYKMLNDNFLSRFRSFMATENHNPAGAFDAMPKTSQRKENTMSKFRYVPVANAGTAGALYMRQRSTNMAFDEIDRTTEFADAILQFLHDKISEQDLEQVKQYLQGEAGVKTDQQEESDKMIAGAEARRAGTHTNTEANRAGAQDRFSPALRRQLDAVGVTKTPVGTFETRFPSAAKIGRDPGYGFR